MLTKDEAVSSLVHQYTEIREQWAAGALVDREAHDTCGSLLRLIDAEVSKGHTICRLVPNGLSLIILLISHVLGPSHLRSTFPSGSSHTYLGTDICRRR